jgi:hypothetical protein
MPYPECSDIQGKLSQRIEPLDFRGQKAVYQVADTGLFAHRFYPGYGIPGRPELTGCVGER